MAKSELTIVQPVETLRVGRRPILAEQQSARVELRIGKRSRFDAEVGVTAAGLLAIGALVSATLLSTAVIIGMATRGRKRA